MKISLNDKNDLHVLRIKLDAMFKRFGDETGLVLSTGNIRFQTDGTSAEIRVKAFRPTSTGAIVTKERKALESEVQRRYPQLAAYVFEGKTLSLGGKTMTLTGYKTRCSRYPFMAQGSDGKNYKLALNHVLQSI